MKMTKYNNLIIQRKIPMSTPALFIAIVPH